MTIAILTTETPHHAHFVREMAAGCGEVKVFLQTQAGPTAPFEAAHPFEAERDRFEWQHWFGGRETRLAELAPVHAFSTMNDPDAVEALRAAAPDLIIVFGTGVLKSALIEACGDRIYNLHGGDPEDYRGLDTHLWAIFHRDFGALVSTLHRLDSGLDTGDIVLQAEVPVTPGMKIHELRAANTDACVAMGRALFRIHGTRAAIGRRQRRQGRYYSAMPASLKGVCKTRFEKHTAGLLS